ncbi:hypothetical protein HN51_003318 [Arachis hypogaea]|nr:uncharacterized protein DS421_1g33040 [Arachis hypogaea]
MSDDVVRDAVIGERRNEKRNERYRNRRRLDEPWSMVVAGAKRVKRLWLPGWCAKHEKKKKTKQPNQAKIDEGEIERKRLKYVLEKYEESSNKLWHLIKEGKEEDVNSVHHHQGERRRPSKELQPKAKEKTYPFFFLIPLEFFSLGFSELT